MRPPNRHAEEEKRVLPITREVWEGRALPKRTRILWQGKENQVSHSSPPNKSYPRNAAAMPACKLLWVWMPLKSTPRCTRV